MLCFVDTETRNAVDITRGNDLYTASAECILLTWAVDDLEPHYWEPLEAPMPPEFDDLLENPNVTFIAHNGAFDRRIFTRALVRPTPISRWRCTMAQAYAHGLPGSLGTLGAVLELAEEDQKRQDDSILIKLFCIPRPDGSWATRRTHPAEWRRFIGYGLNDTIALREIYKRLPSHNYRGTFLEDWHLDQLINERGFAFDAELATAARKMLEAAKIRHDYDTDRVTKGSVQSATQRARLLAWLNQSGLALPNMRASTMREWLEHDDLRPEQRFILELRLEAARSAGSKYKRGLEVMGAQNRIRYAKQFNGAGRTGRWSGRNFQPDNTPRPSTGAIGVDMKSRKVPVKAKFIEQMIVPAIKSGDALKYPLIYGGPNESCSNALRACIIAAPSAENAKPNELVVGDWSNIEGRILAWCSSETWKLDAYAAADRGEAADGYKMLYSRFFGTPVAEIDDNQRQVGKVIDLSCGYLAGVGAFVTMALGYEIDLDTLPPLVLPVAKPEHYKKGRRAWRRAFLYGDDFGLEPPTYIACDILKQVYREANAKITQTGRDVGAACINAVKSPGTVYTEARCRIWSNGSYLIIELPSGRRLLYAKPKLHIERVVELEDGSSRVYEYLSYLTARGRSWSRERAWAGLFIENIVQAIANDVLRAALRLVHADTLTIPEIADYLAKMQMLWATDDETAISLHVHDEISCDVPQGSYPLKRLLTKMTTDLLAANDWMRGLPLAAAGWVGTRYGKK